MKPVYTYIAPGYEKDVGKIEAEGRKLPQMTPEQIAWSEKHGMLKRWAGDDERGTVPGVDAELYQKIKARRARERQEGRKEGRKD